ncbi:Putative restriction endonuclease (fragment) [Planktothrix sp. PCC 11201]|uniref:Uma2 family endonuclease n=1 Tax=Planktothrix sp. PCC 11201 TaxID=1729650 RepID=UPI00091D86CB
MLTEIQQRHYTPEEYLELEEKADSKNEYIDGKIVSMTGGTPNHNDIAGNFYAYLKFALRNQSYKIFISDVRLWIPHYRIYTYPDVMVISGEPILQENRTDTVINPLIIRHLRNKNGEG